MPAEDVSDRQLRAVVRDRIRRSIVDGSFGPGQRLVERQLAVDLGVSRVPVREALSDLVAEGFAVNRAPRGIAVREYPAAEIEELYEIRAALEAMLVRRAVAGLSGPARASLRDCLDAARSALVADDREGAIAANARFHEVLADVAGGPTLRELLMGIRERMRWLLRQHLNPAEINAEHEALFDAMVRGDGNAAERLLEQHLSTSRGSFNRMAAAGWVGARSTLDPPADTRSPDTRSSDARFVDARPPDARFVDARPPDARSSDARFVDARPPDARSSDARPPVARPVDARSSDARSGDAQPPRAQLLASDPQR